MTLTYRLDRIILEYVRAALCPEPLVYLICNLLGLEIAHHDMLSRIGMLGLKWLMRYSQYVTCSWRSVLSTIDQLLTHARHHFALGRTDLFLSNSVLSLSLQKKRKIGQ